MTSPPTLDPRTVAAGEPNHMPPPQGAAGQVGTSPYPKGHVMKDAPDGSVILTFANAEAIEAVRKALRDLVHETLPSKKASLSYLARWRVEREIDKLSRAARVIFGDHP